MAKIEVKLVWNATGLKVEERVIELDENDTISFKAFSGDQPAKSFSFDFGDKPPFSTNPVTTTSPQRVMHTDANFKFKCRVDGVEQPGAELPNPERKISEDGTS